MSVKPSILLKLLLIIGLSALLVVGGIFAWPLHILSAKQEKIKTYYNDVNNITLGLLSVDNWRDQVAWIVNHQVKHFKLTRVEKREEKRQSRNHLKTSIQVRSIPARLPPSTRSAEFIYLSTTTSYVIL